MHSRTQVPAPWVQPQWSSLRQLINLAIHDRFGHDEMRVATLDEDNNRNAPSGVVFQVPEI